MSVELNICKKTLFLTFIFIIDIKIFPTFLIRAVFKDPSVYEWTCKSPEI